MEENKVVTESVELVEIKIDPRGGDHPALTISGSNVPTDLHTSTEKIHRLLDLLEMPKGTKVTINFKASSSVVR